MDANSHQSGSVFKANQHKRENIGEYTLGYTSAAGFPLASALAVSAAFPGGFGPLTLATRPYDWYKREWDAPAETATSTPPTFRRIHLYDGGVYDNMGLEPFFDAGRQRPKHEGCYLICSDASAPLPMGFNFGPLNAFRFKRVADIMSDQSRSLRVRTLVNYLQQAPSSGAYLNINTPVMPNKNCESAEFAASFPTTLRRLNRHEFDKLAEHGSAVAERARNDVGLL